MRQTSILIICLLLLLTPAAASAQVITIDNMQISIWPEYDRPDVLIIYHFTLADSTSLPTKMTMRIPVACGSPFNLAYQSIDENSETELINLEYEMQEQGNWLEISFSAPTSTIQIEYYDPGTIRSGDNRNFTFTWPADYSVGSLSVQIRQPLNAFDMRIDPDPGTGETYQDDQVYYTSEFEQVESGRPFDVQLSYDKPDDTLSSGYEQVYTIDNGIYTQQNTFENALPWVLAGVGIILITFSVVWYLVPTQRISPRKKRAAIVEEGQKPANQRSYCHNCGTRVKPEDEFCPSCGVKLRR